MSKWQRCPDTTQHFPLLARPLPWGVTITYGGLNTDAPDLIAPVWDFSVAELEWLLELAKETSNA